MAAIQWVMVLCLLLQCCLCSAEQTGRGCKTWRMDEQHKDVCCDECRPGNRLVRNCGPSPDSLCTPCEPRTYTVNLKSTRCIRCTQCVGALVQLKACTATSDTVCGCKDGLICGNDDCSFCIKKCGKGEEPAEKRSCRPCPEGTFNDQIHQKCKPWSTKCPHPDGHIVFKGNASADIKCTNVPVKPLYRPTEAAPTEQGWQLVLSTFITIALLCTGTIIIISVVVKMLRKRKKSKKTVTKTPIIRMPTDDPRTLIAIECSFHEAQQEQGSSTESLASKESSDQLIA